MSTSRRRRSSSERQEMVQRWVESGLEKAAFAKQVGISINTLRRWITQSQPGFVEVLAEPRPAACPDFTVRVNGLVIVVPSGFDAAELRRLVETLC